MTPNQLPGAGKGLVIVAHPDDEVIWCGGLVLQHSCLDWTIVALCRGSDTDRRPRFERAACSLNASCLILDIDDSPDLKPLDIWTDVGAPLMAVLPEITWQICLTHGCIGEYGHQRHKDVHEAVMLMIKRKALQSRQVWTFAYHGTGPGSIESDAEADVAVTLQPDIFKRKREIIRDIYGFPEGSYEWNFCLQTETFDHL